MVGSPEEMDRFTRREDAFSRWFGQTFDELPYKDGRVPFTKLPANLQALTFTIALKDFQARHPHWQPGEDEL